MSESIVNISHLTKVDDNRYLITFHRDGDKEATQQMFELNAKGSYFNELSSGALFLGYFKPCSPAWVRKEEIL